MAGGEVQRLDLAMIGYMRLLERFGEGADELARARE